MYKIDFAKQLDAGTSNVEIEGEVTFAKDPLNFKSKPEDKKQYDFWSQWLFVRDETESMGVSITIGKEEDRVNQGDKIKVKGKIDEYTDRDGVLQKKLMGKIVKPKEEVKAEVKEKEQETKVKDVTKKTLVEALTADEVKERREIEKRGIRVKATEVSSKLVVANKLESIKKLFSFAETIVRYIYSGYREELEKKTEVEKIGKKEKLEARITPDEILKVLNKGVNLQTWKEVLRYATLANICPVESTEEDIQKILAGDNKLIQKVIDTKKYRVKEEERERLEEIRAKAEKEGKDKEKEVEVDEYLKEIFIKAKGVGLGTWKEIIYFAVKSDIFQPGIDVSEAKDRLFQHAELYNALSQAIEVRKDVMENVQREEPTDEIPF